MENISMIRSGWEAKSQGFSILGFRVVPLLFLMPIPAGATALVSLSPDFVGRFCNSTLLLAGGTPARAGGTPALPGNYRQPVRAEGRGSRNESGKRRSVLREQAPLPAKGTEGAPRHRGKSQNQDHERKPCDFTSAK
jgi:hypothetical protein